MRFELILTPLFEVVSGGSEAPNRCGPPRSLDLPCASRRVMTRLLARDAFSLSANTTASLPTPFPRTGSSDPSREVMVQAQQAHFDLFRAHSSHPRSLRAQLREAGKVNGFPSPQVPNPHITEGKYGSL
jgi:hypothetical protein